MWPYMRMKRKTIWYYTQNFLFLLDSHNYLTVLVNRCGGKSIVLYFEDFERNIYLAIFRQMYLSNNFKILLRFLFFFDQMI